MKILKELISYIIIIIAALLIRTFIFTPVKVDGTSMVPTLHDSEILILKKYDKTYERFDIVDLTNYIANTYKDSQIVLFGISMGAATVMNASGEKLPKNVKAIIEDCGYTSTWNQFAYQLKALFKLPAFPMMHAASIICKFRSGYFISEASPIKQIKKSTTPTLFIHGDKDGFVPFFMLDKLYNASPVEKEKLIISGAKHARASYVNPKLYWESIENFLNKYIN